MTTRQRLSLALALSALLHVLSFADIEWAWPWQLHRADDVLSKKPADTLKPVRLALSSATPESAWPMVYLIAPEAAAEPVIARARPAEAAPTTAAEPASSPSPVAATASTEPEVAATAPKDIPETIDSAPRFPVQITALHRANYYGVDLKLTQQWFMEGRRYAILNDASKFGFTATLSSEGTISANGLAPERYRLLLNNTLKHYADFDREAGVVIHGKAGQRGTTALTADFQDMASLPYHVAVSYGGEKEKRLMVTTGSSVYEIALNVVSEDELRLPGGILPTIHLTGTRVRSDGTRQSGYDIWLAPSLLNFPVKFRGPDSKGNILEMAVMTLLFDGQAVFGKDVAYTPASPASEQLPDGVLPDMIGTSQASPAQPSDANVVTPSSSE